jgi:hypothetical protein
MVWLLTLPDSQVVTISDEGNTEYLDGAQVGGIERNARWMFKTTASYNIPMPLHTCQESREITQRRYTLSFAEQLSGNPVYFDYDTDMLFFQDEKAVYFFHGGIKFHYDGLPVLGYRGQYEINVIHDMSGVFDKVRFLGLGKFCVCRRAIRNFILHFEKLKTLVLERESRSTPQGYKAPLLKMEKWFRIFRKNQDALGFVTSHPNIIWMTEAQIKILVSPTFFFP